MVNFNSQIDRESFIKQVELLCSAMENKEKIIRSDFTVVDKHGISRKIGNIFKGALALFLRYFGVDIFQNERSYCLSVNIIAFCETNKKHLTADLTNKIREKILEPLNKKTGYRYHAIQDHVNLFFEKGLANIKPMTISEEMDELSLDRLHCLLTQYPFSQNNCRIGKVLPIDTMRQDIHRISKKELPLDGILVKSLKTAHLIGSSRGKETVCLNDSIIKIEDTFYVIGNERIYEDYRGSCCFTKIKNISHIITIEEDGKIKVTKLKDRKEKIVKIISKVLLLSANQLNDNSTFLDKESYMLREVVNSPILQSTIPVKQVHLFNDKDKNEQLALNVHYLVMSRLHGKMAKSIFFGEFALIDRLDIAIDLGEQIDALFKKEWVHNDLFGKNNMMYDEKLKKIQLMDFEWADDTSDYRDDEKYEKRIKDLDPFKDMVEQIFYECGSEDVVRAIDEFKLKHDELKKKERLNALMENFSQFLQKLKDIREKL